MDMTSLQGKVSSLMTTMVIRRNRDTTFQSSIVYISLTIHCLLVFVLSCIYVHLFGILFIKANSKGVILILVSFSYSEVTPCLISRRYGVIIQNEHVNRKRVNHLLNFHLSLFVTSALSFRRASIV